MKGDNSNDENSNIEEDEEEGNHNLEGEKGSVQTNTKPGSNKKDEYVILEKKKLNSTEESINELNKKKEEDFLSKIVFEERQFKVSAVSKYSKTISLNPGIYTLQLDINNKGIFFYLYFYFIYFYFIYFLFTLYFYIFIFIFIYLLFIFIFIFIFIFLYFLLFTLYLYFFYLFIFQIRFSSDPI